MALDFSWVDGDRVMFIGDMVTEDPLGYTRLIPAMVTARYPERRIEYYPRGVGGNRVGDLVERLESDLLGNMPSPSWVGVSIGLNDVQQGATGTPPGRFQELYAELLERLATWKARVVCMTTTVKGEDLQNEDNQRLMIYNDAIRTVAFQHGADVVDVNQAFHVAIRQAQAVNPDFRYTIDGERLNVYGNYLLAFVILQSLNFSLRMEGGMSTGYEQGFAA
ncbi:MAG: GDSL-type esterase/lipase family protein [Armatimonadota bacterium]